MPAVNNAPAPAEDKQRVQIVDKRTPIPAQSAVAARTTDDWHGIGNRGVPSDSAQFPNLTNWYKLENRL